MKSFFSFTGQGRRLALGETVLSTLLLALMAAVAGASWYGYRSLTALEARIETLDARLTSSTTALSATLGEATSTLSQNIAGVKTELGGFADTVKGVSGTVKTLEKLTQTDPELLAKYSKVFFLSEHYAPARLVEIPDAQSYYNDRDTQIIPEVLPYFSKMLEEAKDDGIELYAYSAYRSFDSQHALKGRYTVTYGAGTANQFSADQGYSEHQLGTTIDLMTTGINGDLNAFGKTPAYDWLVKNAYRFGFILSYPQGNAFYTYEPWHWRFVGRKLARDLHKDNAYFYNLDQRTIDSYLPYLFD